MKAMFFDGPKQPFRLVDAPKPRPSSGQVLIKVAACAICRTDLHIIEGELTQPKLPLILGHQIVGKVTELGDGVSNFEIGERVGVPWLGGSCHECEYCLDGRENLCDHASYTGYQINGGFAEFCVANADFCFPVPESYKDANATPLLCAGLIGYRSFRMTKKAKKVGFYGFGNAAHILIQLARYQKKEIFAFTRPGDVKNQEEALKMGATWAGGSDQSPPTELDASIIFASEGALIPLALKSVKKGGSVICAGIHMSPIPSFSYDLLYGERILTSVTNLTRQDGEEFIALASKIHIQTDVTTYRLDDLNQAFEDVRTGKVNGSAVIIPD